MDFKEIDHLLKLARIELSSQEKEKIVLDLENILNYVKQLQKLNTDGVEPMTGGTFLENIYRSDEIDKQKKGVSETLKKSAPCLKDDYFERSEKQGSADQRKAGSYFKIPPIF